MTPNPPAPDPYVTASAQTGSNVDSTVAAGLINNVDQNTPFGSVKYTQNGNRSFVDSTGKTVSIPNYQSNTTFSPEQQALYDKQISAGKNLGDAAVSQSANLVSSMSQPFNPDLGPTDFSADRRSVEDALLSRFNEDFTRDEAGLQNKLINQGLTPGSEAYNAEMTRLDRAKNDARSQAVIAGGQEQSRLAGLRNQSLQEKLAVRNQPINEITALMSGGQVTAPSFSGPYQQGVGAAPVGDYINQNYQNQLKQANANNSGLFGLGSSLATGLFSLSDRRAKTAIKRIGATEDGLGIYKYRYKGDAETRVGLMAQEVAEVKPHAVTVRPDGLMAVDYAAALAEAA